MLDQRVIRLAMPAEAGEIALMSRDHIEQGLGWTWRRDRIARAMDACDTNVAVVAVGNTIQAFGIMRYGDTAAHLELFAVRPGCRRRGMGRGLLAWLELVASNAGLARLQMQCRAENVGARQFYRAQGYSEIRVATDMYGSGMHGVQLEKRRRPVVGSPP